MKKARQGCNHRYSHRFSYWILVFFWGTLQFTAPVEGRNPKRHDTAKRPNIVFAIADDWGWSHASVYGDPVVKTPTFDRIAREGVLFQNAYVSSPSCTPSRNAILTGQYHWRLGWGANLWSKLETKHATYPLMLEDDGYFVGHYRKSWGPGKLDNWSRHPAGPKFKSVDAFFEARPKDKPFCFWFGASDPHRPYKKGTGKASGMDLDKVKLFPHFPDNEVIRSDVADYYFEVQRFDSEVGELLKRLEVMGELENTLVVMTGDHGMPFPRCKANLYDSGTRVPMAVRWPSRIKGGRSISDFVSTTDIAPTFLEVGLKDKTKIPQTMTGRSWVKLLTSSQDGRVDPTRDKVFFGKERHVPCQEGTDSGGTPMRGIRTDQFLLIWNLRPDRWPSGTPNYKQAYIPFCWLGDCDNGPTKTYLVEHQNDSDASQKFFDLSFGKRPEFEMYDCRKDPGQIENLALKNLAHDKEYQLKRDQLIRILKEELVRTGDPRLVGGAEALFEETKYFGFGPRHPSYRRKKRKSRKN